MTVTKNEKKTKNLRSTQSSQETVESVLRKEKRVCGRNDLWKRYSCTLSDSAGYVIVRCRHWKEGATVLQQVCQLEQLEDRL